MLREYGPERRRLRDDAESSRARQERYESSKLVIAETAVDADDYDARVRALVMEMGI